MFTGIIDHRALVTAISHQKNSIQLTLATAFSDLVLGESISVDGVCLTVTAFFDNTFVCGLSKETCALTIAKQYRIGSTVNVERAMTLSERLGGHIVTGHVDGVIRVKKLEQHGEFILCEFSDSNPVHAVFLIAKGSVCINGVSLTLNIVHPDYFSVMLIPHTLERTNLSQVNRNDCVNVEYDYLAKLVSNNINYYRGVHV